MRFLTHTLSHSFRSVSKAIMNHRESIILQYKAALKRTLNWKLFLFSIMCPFIWRYLTSFVLFISSINLSKLLSVKLISRMQNMTKFLIIRKTICNYQIYKTRLYIFDHYSSFSFFFLSFLIWSLNSVHILKINLI